MLLNQTYKLTSITLAGPADGTAPATVKLFVNKTAMSFDDCEDFPATQTLTLSSASAMRAPTASMTSREPVNCTSSSSPCGRACEDMVDPSLNYYESGLLIALIRLNRCGRGG